MKASQQTALAICVKYIKNSEMGTKSGWVTLGTLFFKRCFYHTSIVFSEDQIFSFLYHPFCSWQSHPAVMRPQSESRVQNMWGTKFGSSAGYPCWASVLFFFFLSTLTCIPHFTAVTVLCIWGEKCWYLLIIENHYLILVGWGQIFSSSPFYSAVPHCALHISHHHGRT